MPQLKAQIAILNWEIKRKKKAQLHSFHKKLTLGIITPKIDGNITME